MKIGEILQETNLFHAVGSFKHKMTRTLLQLVINEM